jgi:preprotein translocase SecE subunit
MDKSPQPASHVPAPFKTKRGGIKGFFSDVARELKKVDWPAPKETNRLTGVVLAVCALVVLILFGMSIVADTIVQMLQGRGIGR